MKFTINEKGKVVDNVEADLSLSLKTAWGCLSYAILFAFAIGAGIFIIKVLANSADKF